MTEKLYAPKAQAGASMHDERFQTRLNIEQPIAFRTLYNSLKNEKLAHAYLFAGPAGTPKKETAYLLAQSLICPNRNVFACESCDDCHRVMEGNYADLIYLDGENRVIKLEQVQHIQEEFNKTGLEEYNRKVYIIDHAENATSEALNALLKFLEEPAGVSITAILLTEQSDRLLPTIRSRCQIIQFKALSAQVCYNICVARGYDPLDAYLLSRLYRDMGRISVALETEEYQTGRELFKRFIRTLPKNSDMALVELENEPVLKSKKDKSKETVKYFVDITTVFFTDLHRECNDSLPWYEESLALYRNGKYDNKKVLDLFLEAQNKLLPGSPYNLLLILEQLVYRLQEVS